MPTLTVYPNADPETTSVDGRAVRLSVDEPFATIRAGAGNFAEDNSGTIYIWIDATTTTNQFSGLHRGIFLFDTSAIPVGAVILSATLSVWGQGESPGLGSPDLCVVSANPASNTGLVNADYSTLGTTLFGSVPFASFVFNDTAYTDISLNANGLAAIVPGGISKFGLTNSWDQTGSFTGTWVANAASYFQIAGAENASGTAKAPKLTITYADPDPTALPFRTQMSVLRI